MVRYMPRLVSLWLPLVLSACASTAPGLPAENVVLATNVLRSAEEDVAGAVRLANKSQKTVVTEIGMVVVGRHNRARCECPEFELLLEGRWTRVYWRTPEEGADLPLMLQNVDSSGTTLLLVRARLTGELRTAPNDNEYGVAEVTEVRDIGSMSTTDAMRLVLTGGSPEPKESEGTPSESESRTRDAAADVESSVEEASDGEETPVEEGGVPSEDVVEDSTERQPQPEF